MRHPQQADMSPRVRIFRFGLVWASLLAGTLIAGALPGATRAQTAPASPAPALPGPSPSPGTPPPGTPPPATLTQPAPGSPAPAPTPPAAPVPPLATLVPQAGDPGDVDEVVLTAKPVAIVSGQASWDDGLKTMRGTLTRMRTALDRAGIKVVGRPLAVFTETSDDNFKYEAQWPIELPASSSSSAPPASPEGSGIRFGATPAGKAWRFVHKGPYDEIDSTYETITAYLDAKDIVAKDAFIEEYLSDTADTADTSMEVNIFVQPK